MTQILNFPVPKKKSLNTCALWLPPHTAYTFPIHDMIRWRDLVSSQRVGEYCYRSTEKIRAISACEPFPWACSEAFIYLTPRPARQWIIVFFRPLCWAPLIFFQGISRICEARDNRLSSLSSRISISIFLKRCLTRNQALFCALVKKLSL